MVGKNWEPWCHSCGQRHHLSFNFVLSFASFYCSSDVLLTSTFPFTTRRLSIPFQFQTISDGIGFWFMSASNFFKAVELALWDFWITSEASCGSKFNNIRHGQLRWNSSVTFIHCHSGGILEERPEKSYEWWIVELTQSITYSTTFSSQSLQRSLTLPLQSSSSSQLSIGCSVW